MVKCSVRNCKRQPRDGVSFHRFPRDETLISRWLQFCEATEPPDVNGGARVCSAHFDESCRYRRPMDIALGTNPKHIRSLTKDAVPSLNGPSDVASNRISLGQPQPTSTETILQRASNSDGGEFEKRINEIIARNNAVIHGSSATGSGYYFTTNVESASGHSATVYRSTSNDVNDETENGADETSTIDNYNDAAASSSRDESIECSWKNSAAPKTLVDRRTEPSYIPSQIENIIATHEQSMLGSKSTERGYKLVKIEEWEDLISSRQKHCIQKGKYDQAMEQFEKDTLLYHKTNDERDARIKSLTTELEQVKRETAELHEKYKQTLSENKRIEAERQQIQCQYSQLMTAVRKYFSEGQIRRILCENVKKKFRWSNDEIASAISLRCASIKSYKYLKRNLHFPLPDLSTLRRWAARFPIEEGVLHRVLMLMKVKGQNMTKMEKLTVLSFDEMSISKYFCYERSTDTIYGDTGHVQVIMSRGLVGNWKQPVAFYFDTQMAKPLLTEVITRMYEVDFTVVGVVSDLGGGNRSFHREVGISSEYLSFEHPCDPELRIFFFADVPHLLKLIRNNFLDYGFMYKDTEITKRTIQEILSLPQEDVTITHKLDLYKHLEIEGTDRQRVSPAAQLLSETTAKLVDYCCERKLIAIRNHEVVSRFFSSINRWFDLLNTYDYEDSIKETQAYGLAVEEQDKLLDEVAEMMMQMRIIKKLKSGRNTNEILPFQKGVVLTIRSLQQMFQYLKQKYDVQYILTKRLNQDTLENFFGYIRGMGATNDHPTPIDFKNRLRLYVLGKESSAVLTEKRNTKDTPHEKCLVSPTRSFNKPSTSRAVTPPLEVESAPDGEEKEGEKAGTDAELLTAHLKVLFEKKAIEDRPDDVLDIEMAEISEEVPDEVVNPAKVIKKEGLKHIGGFVAFKFKKKYPHLGKKSSELSDDDKSWIKFVSKGNLTVPAPRFVDCLEVLDKVFRVYHGPTTLKKGKKNVASVITLAQPGLMKEIPRKILQEIPAEVMTYFVRFRTYIRINRLNVQMRFNKARKSEDRSHQKKMKKTINQSAAPKTVKELTKAQKAAGKAGKK